MPLQQTSDGTLVVHHDQTLDRTARGPAENCTGLVATKTLGEPAARARPRSRLPLVQLFSSRETSESVQARLDAVSDYAVAIGPSKTDVDADLVRAAQARCLDVHPYTLEDLGEMRALIDLGVDGVFANFPARLDEVLGKDALGGKQAARRAARAPADCVGHVR